MLKVRRIVPMVASIILCTPCFAADVQLDVPLIKQTKGRLCGPAAVEMVFRFWGEKRFDQYEIAHQIATEYATEKRFSDNPYARTRKAGDYPGTPVYILRKYLASKGQSEKYSLKTLPASADVLERKFQHAFTWIKNHLDQGVPVVVHQYWTTASSTGHYRVVTGYDDRKKLVYLNDAKAGKITQSYTEFKQKGAFAGKWMPYYSIAFKNR